MENARQQIKLLCLRADVELLQWYEAFMLRVRLFYLAHEFIVLGSCCG
jgi:hypothetical protein